METTLAKIEQIAPPTIPANWDFNKADKDFDKYIHNWRRLTENVLAELWVFYNKLKVGHRRKSVANATQLPTWEQWIEAKGIDRSTAFRHFKALGWLIDNKPHVALNSGENEWYTPPEYTDAARLVMGTIDIDPASTATANSTVKAKKFYNVKTNGLKKKWAGNVWMNPPYAQPFVTDFCEAFIDKYKAGEIEQGCVLINNATETQFGQNLMVKCSAICFPNGRVKFLDIDGKPGAPLQGQMILYFGSSAKTFVSGFSQFGVCFKK